LWQQVQVAVVVQVLLLLAVEPAVPVQSWRLPTRLPQGQLSTSRSVLVAQRAMLAGRAQVGQAWHLVEAVRKGKRVKRGLATPWVVVEEVPQPSQGPGTTTARVA